MFEDLINIFYYSILFPLMDGFKVFIRSNEFYFTFIVIFLLSIPITIMRCYQVLTKGKTKFNTFYEILVWLFRIIQYSLIIFISNDIPVRSLFSENNWNHIFQNLHHIHLEQLFWDFVGYGLIFGIYNLLIYTVIRKKWIAIVLKKMYDNETNTDLIHQVIVIGIKNLFLIPVSVIYLLSILKII